MNEIKNYTFYHIKKIFETDLNIYFNKLQKN